MGTVSRAVLAGLAVGVLAACGNSASPVVAFSASPLPTRPTPATSPAARPTPAARACQAHDLALDFRGGGLATGNDIGSLVIRDISVTDCHLVGKVLVTPLDSMGIPIRTYTPMNAVSAPEGLVLSARSPEVPSGQTATDGKVRALLTFAGAERDDPKPPNGMCPNALEVTPASWRVQLAGGFLVVPNRDPGSDVPNLYGCRASFFEMSLETM